MTTFRNEQHSQECNDWAFCVCDESQKHRDFVSFASETADWDATPEDVAYALRATRGAHGEEQLGKALDHCFGLDLIEHPFGLEE